MNSRLAAALIWVPSAVIALASIVFLVLGAWAYADYGLVGVVLNRPASPDQPDLLPRLVKAGGLAIEIARLRVELRRQLAEVEAAVGAGDAG